MTFPNDPSVWLKELFVKANMGFQAASFLSTLALVVTVIVLSWLSNILAKVVIEKIVTRIVKKTTTTWDDVFLEKKVFTRLSHLAPAWVIWSMAGWALKAYPLWLIFVHNLTYVYMVVAGTVVLLAFVDAWHIIYKTLPISQHRPISGYVQVVKIVIIVIALLTVISVVFRKDISNIVAGLGAMAAVIVLIFKDTILGLVASIQLSSNKMVTIGDWITIPNRNVDGNVTDITLTTVKVQNFDKTIITLPTYSLVNESFQNWKGMEESGIRQIKRAVYIDMKSIRFLDDELKERLSRIESIREMIEATGKLHHNPEINERTTTNTFVYSQRLTNLAVFRFYVETFLRNHPLVDSSQTIIVRHREPDPRGLPLQVYAFAKNNLFVPFENVQSEILEHMIAMVPEFGLKVFQEPSGDDMALIAGISGIKQY